ncbi:LacI family DNA-binding transcriptional regulator [Micromonospora sp. DT81.3]|uniref:LacI family DNA-binding transcriptional regulator n=1 Tax=Micromonospora sp. DT81.3 TaxID=3416523 RepID=UPI003CF63210
MSGSSARPDIRDIAAAAGVSPTTVSHAISGARPVKESTRERVLDVARAMGYVPNRAAIALRRNRTGVVGFVGDRISSTPHAGRVLLGAQDQARERDTVLMVVESEADPELERQQLQMLLERGGVDGVIYARMSHEVVAVPDRLLNVPTVLVHATDPDRGYSSVVPDERQIGRIALKHLTALGHREIAMASTVDDTPARAGRELEWRRAFDAPEAQLVRVASTAVGGREAAAALFSGTEMPTAVFCFNDQIAMGVYQGAAARGLRVPDDVSIVGVDDLEIIAAGLDPGLTTVALPHFQMGAWAMSALAAEMDDEKTVRTHAEFPCALVIRDSTAPPRR